jgi:antitoxin (DNA-binding transcriptional repressor) of toxin-antitoxin stability system
LLLLAKLWAGVEVELVVNNKEKAISATITVEEAQATLKELIHQLAPGEEVVITDNQQRVAKLVAEQPSKRKPRQAGRCKGMITLLVEDDEHLQGFINEGIAGNDFEILSVEVHHAAALAALPFPPNHKDPFDRLIVAQAIVEGLPLISIDPQLDAYPIKRLW